VLRDLGLTSNQVWGLTKTDQEWSEQLETALTAARRNDLKHGTNAAYVHGCVCHECREHQLIRLGRNRWLVQACIRCIRSSGSVIRLAGEESRTSSSSMHECPRSGILPSGKVCRVEIGGKMIKINKLAGTLIAAGALLAVAAPAAHAAPPEPFTITEDIDFNSEAPPTFTATGPLCASGTFEDVVVGDRFRGNPDTTGKFNLLLRTVFTCDDGSGTFNAQKHVFVTQNEDGSSTNTGPITFSGGTGDYTGLSGHGVDEGTTTADNIGTGNISGVVSLG
jgi:hypothetical protein